LRVAEQVCQAASAPCQLPASCDGTNRDCPDAAVAPEGADCGPGCLCDGVSEGMALAILGFKRKCIDAVHKSGKLFERRCKADRQAHASHVSASVPCACAELWDQASDCTHPLYRPLAHRMPPLTQAYAPPGCPAGFYVAPGDATACAACPTGCAACTAPLGLCSQCAPGYQLLATTATCQQRARCLLHLSGRRPV